MKQITGPLTKPFLQASTARQRAFLKLGAFFLGAFLFILLACMPPAPPPFYIDLLAGPPSLLSGEEAVYTFHAHDERVAGVLSTATIGVTGRFRTENGRQSSVELNLPPTVTTDQQGEFQLVVKMPEEAALDDLIELVFEPQDEELNGRASVALTVMPEVSLFPLDQESAYNAGPVTNMLVQVFDNRAQLPLPNVPWRTNTRSLQAGVSITDSGVTNDDGIVEIQIDSRDTAVLGVHYDFGLIVETDNGEFSTWLNGYKGTETFDVLLSTDKPIYQPGQTIHVRALALMKTNMKAAADSAILLQLIDPNGTVVGQTEMNTSDYGVSSADFALDSQIGSGDYTLRAETIFGIYNRIVEVKPYTLPRFEITITSDEPFFTPGSTASGTVDASYFFGKPVSNGTVRITGSAPDAPGSPDVVDIFTLEGETDESGRYAYAIDLPDTLVGHEAHESVTVDLDVTVIDSANHAEETDATLTVAQQPLAFEAVAESGTLRAGIENIVYIQASTPDGRPAQALISVNDGERTQQLETDPFGLAQVSVFPPQGQRFLPLEITAQGVEQRFSRVIDLSIEGNSAGTSLSDSPSPSLLLRPEKAEFVHGEPINVDVLLASDQEASNNGQLVLIEVKKHGYLYSSQAVSIFGGRGRASIAVDLSLVGTVAISAKLLGQDDRSATLEYGYSSGYPAPRGASRERGANLAQDSRLVLINPSAMQVHVNADADQYRPGESATLDIQLNQDGAPIQGLLGVAIVDESVFALGAQDPAFARTYFLIDKELTRPHYGIEGFVPFGGEPSPYVDLSRTASHSGDLSAITHMVPGEGNVERSLQMALFGALAQELQWTATAHAAAATPPVRVSNQASSHNDSVPPVGSILMVMAAAAVITTTRVITTKGNRKQSAITIGIIVTSALIWTACASAPASAPPAEMPAPADSGEAFRETGGSIMSEQSAAKPRLRQFFPETLLWLPDVETDASGRAQIDLTMADSITTWRVSVIASDKEGNLGSAQLPMQVFQDFFVEPSLPLYLTEGDEIEVPVSVFNYLDEAQIVDLELAEADWFELNGEFDASMTVAANEVAATDVSIRVLDAGVGDFQLTAIGSRIDGSAGMSDAVARQVTVAINGERQEQIINGRLGETASHEITIDERSHADESTITVRFYPSPLSEMVSGLEAMLQEPTGCFEQTSSSNYPNVMILDYLRETGQSEPDIEYRASGLVKKGYQRLLTFEVNNSPGAFSLWGDPPPQLMLTAYGLMQFSDQSRVTFVDPALIERIAAYLIQQQNPDGSWTPTDSFVHGDLGPDVRNDVLATAFITWALAESGQDSKSVRMGIDYLAQAVEQQQVDTNYALAMTVNAFIAAGHHGQQIEQLLDQLAGAAIETGTGAVAWSAGRATYLGGYAEAADVETSAMAAIALLKSEQRLDVAGKAIQGLQEARGSRGYYYSTQATVLVLKALTLSEQWRASTEEATVTVSVNGQESQSIDVSDVDQDRPVEVVFTDVPAGVNEISLAIDGEQRLSYQIMAESYLPWDVVMTEDAANPQTAQPNGEHPTVDIAVAYDTNDVALNESVTVEAEMSLLADEPVANIMAEIGLPPGFRPSLADLDQLVGQTVVADYEIRRDGIFLYLSGMEPKQTYAFAYELTATMPGTVQAPPSFGYPYYASNLRTIDAPQTLVVRE